MSKGPCLYIGICVFIVMLIFGAQRYIEVNVDSSTVALSLIKAIEDEDRRVCEQGFRALSQIGKGCIPVLIEALKEDKPDVNWRVAWVLGQIGPRAKDAVPLLQQTLKYKDWRRIAAAMALAKIGPDSNPPIEILIKETEGPYDYLAAEALGEIGPVAKAAIPALIKLLNSSKHWQSRMNAASALGKILQDQ